MGDGNSVTRGVISAPITEVFIPGRARALPVFQTDAAINYGMGGGLLVNARSEVIGINLAYTHRGGLSGFGVPLAEGMSYSISINEVAPLLIQMIEDLRRPPRPAIGIMGRTISEGIAEMLGVPPLGVHVSRAIEGGAAYDAGVLADDIITGMDDMPIFNMEQLQAAIAALSVGDTVELNILRDGEIVTLRMTLGEMVINFDVQ
jgi:serine protease Do